MKTLYIDGVFFGVYDEIDDTADGLMMGDRFLPYAVIGNYTIEDGANYPQMVEVVEVPQSLKMAQCRAQLILDGKDDDVELLINSIEDPIKQKLYRAFWEYEPIVLRDNAMINEMASALAIDLDTFFINASKL